MAKFPELPDREPLFVGRRRELEEIQKLFYRAYPPPVLKVIGPPGIGKTAFVREVLARETLDNEFRRLTPVWFSFNDISEHLESFDEMLRRTLIRGESLEDLRPFGGGAVIILDGVEGVSQEKLERLRHIIFNYKRVGGLIITSRNELQQRRQQP